MDELIRLAGANLISWIFTISIIVMFFVWARSAKKRPEKRDVLNRTAPTLLTTLGILGTFVGVYAGLLDFKVHDIDGSIPTLLEGLKTAFWTSIVGMGMGLSWRLGVPRWLERNSVKDSQEEGGPEQIYQTFKNIENNTEKQVDAFENFAKNVGEMSTEALKEVIEQFKIMLDEKIFNAFENLKQSVDNLVKWQESYKEHIEKLEENFEVAVEGIKESEESLANISENTQKIPETMAQLEPLITALQHQAATLKVQTEDMGEHLSAFATLKDEAVKAFPVIQKHLEDLLNEISNKTGEVLNNIKKMQEHLQNFAEGMEKTTEEALKQALANLANNLATLSEKFVKDYAPLADALEKIPPSKNPENLK